MRNTLPGWKPAVRDRLTGWKPAVRDRLEACPTRNTCPPGPLCEGLRPRTRLTDGGLPKPNWPVPTEPTAGYSVPVVVTRLHRKPCQVIRSHVPVVVDIAVMHHRPHNPRYKDRIDSCALNSVGYSIGWLTAIMASLSRSDWQWYDAPRKGPAVAGITCSADSAIALMTEEQPEHVGRDSAALREDRAEISGITKPH